MPFPDGVAAEFLAHEHLQQLLADGLDRGIGQKDLDLAAAVVHVDPEIDEDGGIGGTGDRGETRVGLETFEAEGDRGQRLERLLGIFENDLDHAPCQRQLDRGVGPPLDPDYAPCPPAAEQHVDHRVDEVGIDGQKPEILPFL